MAFENILICLNCIESNPALMNAARHVASHFKGRVIGVYFLPPEQSFRTAAHVRAPDASESSRTYFEKHQTAVRMRFEHVMKSEAVPAEFLAIETETHLFAGPMIEQARLADLVIASVTQDQVFRGFESDFAERVILQCGRPVLVIPGAPVKAFSFEHVIVAWDHGREATRALADSMPLLQDAHGVHVITAGEERRGVELAQVLRRKGIQAEAEQVGMKDDNIAHALLSRARHHAAGLIVMGCYGHSRFAELVLGGTTRKMLREFDRPLFLSH
jgi:nucleotide-binding universal stress UspA family protein